MHTQQLALQVQLLHGDPLLRSLRALNAQAPRSGHDTDQGAPNLA